MKKFSVVVSAILASAVALVLCCGTPQNPYTNPKSAQIVADSSLTSLQDSVKMFKTVPCSVSLYLPNLIDSIHVHVVKSGFDTIIAGGKVSSDEFTFDFTAALPGVYQLKVFIVRSDNSIDSLIRQVTVYVLLPVVTPDSAAYHVILPVDSFTFNFTAVGPDSNLRFGYTWIDTSTSQTQLTAFSALKPYHETFSRTIHALLLHAGLHAPIVCHAYAINADSLVSAVASCTLYVTDTTRPAIQLVVPDTSVTITTLPVTIKTVVTDLAGIDAVTFNGAPMILTNDTATYVASSIDSGKSLDTIIALDNSGNKGVLAFPLTYAGKQLHPPKIIDLSRATTEGHPFSPISLDASVTLTDTSIKDTTNYKKDSLTWVITDSLGNQIAVPASHMITIPFPIDTEWTGTIKLTFHVTAKNNPALYDTKQPSFFVAEVYDPPVITFQSTMLSLVPYSSPIYLDTVTTVRALDNKFADLAWTFKNGKHFKVDSLYSIRIIPGLSKAASGQADSIKSITPIFGFFTRHVKISPLTVADSTFFGKDTLQFMVKSPQISSPVSMWFYFSHIKLTPALR
jgi:hypothetical protein